MIVGGGPLTEGDLGPEITRNHLRERLEALRWEVAGLADTAEHNGILPPSYLEAVAQDLYRAEAALR